MSVFAEEEKKKEKNVKPAVQTKETVQRDLSDVNGPEGGMLPESVSAKIQSKRGTGQRLSDRNLRQYSQKFGRDMSDVHVHTDAESDTISRSLNARAFTIGSDVFLTKGIDPEGGGRDAQTMAHELTHVVQQGGHGGSGRLKLGAADTAQEHEAESTAQREFDPRLKEDEDTIQRGFWDSLGSAIGTKLLDSVGMNEAYDEFMGGDKKVKAAIGKMPQAKKAEYETIEQHINQLDDTDIPDLEKKIKNYQKQIKKMQGDPTKDGERRSLSDEVESTQQVLDSKRSAIDMLLKEQLSRLQAFDATITTDDVNRYRSGKAKTFFSTMFASIGGKILGAFENDPEKKAAAQASGRSFVNTWFASKNKTSLEGESESEKANKAEEMKQKQAALVDRIWNEIQQDTRLKRYYSSKLLFKREIAKNHMTLIQESIKDGESEEDIIDAVVATLKQNAESAMGKRPPENEIELNEP